MEEETPISIRQSISYSSASDSQFPDDFENPLPIISSNINPRYRRWVLLMMFCSLAFLQTSVFVAWNPIGNSALVAFGPEWSASTLAWQINLATIANPLVQYPVWRFMRKYDLSKTLRWGASFPLCVATFLQLIPLIIPDTSNEALKWLSFISFIFIGIVGVVFFSSITRFSSLWFPKNQRTTATGLSCTFANLGALLPALSGPQIVSDPNRSITDPAILRTEIMHYILMLFLLSLILFLGFFFYFPSEKTQVYVDIDDFEVRPVSGISYSIKCLLSKPVVVTTVLVYSLDSLTHVWGSTLLTLTLSSLKITQTTIGIMTIAAILVTAVLTVCMSWIADVYFQRDIRQVLMILLPTHALAMIVFCTTVLTLDRDKSNEVIISVLYVIALTSLNACTPLLFEFGCEKSFPISEDIVSGSFDQTVNVFSIIFHSMFTYIASTSSDFSAILYLLMVIPSLTFAAFTFVKD